MMNQEYFQIFENGHPLRYQTFETLKAARARLKTLLPILQSQGDALGYDVRHRLAYIPIRNTLGIHRVYADGTEIAYTYSIRLVTFKAQF